MAFIENHCHLTDEIIFSEAEIYLNEAKVVGVRTIVLAGTEPVEWDRQLELKRRLQTEEIGSEIKLIHNFGLHPWWVEKFSDEAVSESLSTLKEKIQFAQGLGETGLDFSKKRNPARFQMQELAFREQIQIARYFKKPLILHIVSAHEKSVSILKEENAHSDRTVPLVIHRYSGNSHQLKSYLDLGAFISFCGSSLCGEGIGFDNNFKNSFEKAKQALLVTPLDRLLFETDAPDRSWKPSQVVQVYQQAAKLLNVDIALLAEKVAENFSKIY